MTKETLNAAVDRRQQALFKPQHGTTFSKTFIMKINKHAAKKQRVKGKGFVQPYLFLMLIIAHILDKPLI
jgi:hypothetical protein